MAPLRSFEEFWPFYVSQHLHPTNQRFGVADRQALLRDEGRDFHLLLATGE